MLCVVSNAAANNNYVHNRARLAAWYSVTKHMMAGNLAASLCVSRERE